LQAARLWRFAPNVLNNISSISSKEKEEFSTHEVQQVVNQASLSQPTIATLLRGITGNIAVEQMDLI
jgi:hypothetical protein